MITFYESETGDIVLEGNIRTKRENLRVLLTGEKVLSLKGLNKLYVLDKNIPIDNSGKDLSVYVTLFQKGQK